MTRRAKEVHSTDLMVAEAPLFHERGARGAGGVTVAVVGDQVATRMLPGTRLAAFRRPRPTRYRCTQAGATTVAAQVLEACAGNVQGHALQQASRSLHMVPRACDPFSSRIAFFDFQLKN